MSTEQHPEQDGSRARVEKDSILLQTEIKSWWVYRVMAPLEDFCVRSGIDPNSITFAATAVCLLCFFRFATGHILSSGWLILLAGSLDILDGRVARASGKVTRQGAFLDSVMDRYQDFLIFAGLAVCYRESLVLYLVLAALAGTMFVSYVRARAENEGVDLANVGAMQRPERFFLLGFGSIVSSVFQISLMPFFGWDNPQIILMLVIAALAVSTNWTAMKRIRYTLYALKEKERN